MGCGRRRFSRPYGRRRYRKLYIIATEGMKTEPQYFSFFENHNSTIHVKCLKQRSRNSPPQVLARMKKYLRKEALRSSDEAWLVVDKDQWNDSQLAQLHEWSLEQENYGFALSNPKFEYWILLHFEDGAGIANSQQCSDRLKQYLPEYDKGVDAHKITEKRIADAVYRAKTRDNPPCADWPRTTGTTVYRLIESIQNA